MIDRNNNDIPIRPELVLASTSTGNNLEEAPDLI